MNIWTKEDIENILLQLNELGMPFEKYSFLTENNELKLLGRGGIGYVYEAVKKGRSKKKFAIKVNGFRKKMPDTELFKKSMEHQALLGISNENVVKIYAFTEIFVWLDEEHTVVRAKKATEEEQEGALRLQFVLMAKEAPIITVDRCRKKEITCPGLREYEETEVLRLATDIGHILRETHKDRVLHKDVKLENIFYSDTKKKYMLGDFGIAEEVKDGTSTVFSGTEGYAAPEVLALKWRHDATADIYSLGMVLYLLMNDCYFPESAKRFWPNKDKQYVEGYIPSRPKHGSDELWAIVEKMCMYDADDRYQHMEEVLDDIKQLIYEEELYYKQQHRKSYLLMSGILLFFGIWTAGMGGQMGLQPEDIRWIKILLFSLSFIMLAYGGALMLKWETPFERDGYTKGTFWRLVLLVYMLTALAGLLYSGKTGAALPQKGQNGFMEFYDKASQLVIEFDFLKIGLAGTLFCIFWSVRERLLLLLEQSV